MTRSTTYELSTDTVLQGLADMRDRKLLCDVHLVAEDESFPAHRVVLAAASPYFQAMFTGGFKENGLDVVTMEEINAEGLNCVLDAIYASKITLNEETIENVLSVANLFQLNDIIDACENFLGSNISENNCVLFLSICEKYGIQNVLKKINDFIIGNFDTIVKTEDFCKISKDTLCKYISDDRLKVSTDGEIVAFRAAAIWLEHNLTAQREEPEQETEFSVPDEDSEDFRNDTDDITEVMRDVRFPRIPADVLIDEVMQLPLVYENRACRNLVTEALRFHSHPFTQPLQEGPQYRPRGEQRLVLVSCGTRDNGYVVQEKETGLHILNVSDEESAVTEDSVTDFPLSFAFRSMSVVTKGNYLFLFATDNTSFNSVALRFDAVSQKWTDLKSPPCQACIGSAVSRCGNEIYLTGGMIVTKDSGAFDPRFFTSKTLQYSIGSNTWVEVCAMPQPVTYHAAASHAEFVYVAGGYIGLRVSDTTPRLFAYDIRGNLWLAKAEMHHSRYQFCLETVNDHLYACGGRSIDYNTGETSIEMYSILEDQWTVLENAILEHCVSSATFTVDNKLYIVGGRRKDDDGKWCDSDLISCIDVADNSLLHVMNLPFQSARHVCAILTIPRT